MFLAIEDLLNDLDGEFDDMQQDDGSEKSNEDDLSSKLSSDASMKQRKRDQMKKSKKKEPQLNPSTLDQDGNLTLESVNIKEITVKYYKIDAEILFSRAPFLKDNAEEFSYVTPYHQQVVEIWPETAIEEDLQ